MALTIGAILALLGVAVAVYPFLRHRFLAPAPREDEVAAEAGRTGNSLPDSGELADELETIYAAIGTLQLERQLGNIPEGLYREQLNGYRRQAARLLRQREREQAGNEDWALEEEIKVARAGLYRPQEGGDSCPNCGRPVPPGADSCSECGVALRPESRDEVSPVSREEQS